MRTVSLKDLLEAACSTVKADKADSEYLAAQRRDIVHDICCTASHDFLIRLLQHKYRRFARDPGNASVQINIRYHVPQYKDTLSLHLFDDINKLLLHRSSPSFPL